MERPSHIIFDTQSRHVAQRLPFVALAFSLQFAVFLLFTHGLVGHWTKYVPPVIDLVRVQDPEQPRVKPPEPHIPTRIEGPQVTKPIVDLGPRQTGNAISLPPPAETNQPPTAAGPDRAPVAILSTHTVPPYPPIARRIGAEGKVTLQLTVSAQGRVSQADIVTSSGRDDLDQTARQWIVAHWAYKPALDKGVPAVSHVLASVTFSLINAQ